MKRAYHDTPAPKLGSTKVNAIKWDKILDVNLVVGLGSQHKLNKSHSEYQAQHSTQPIAGLQLSRGRSSTQKRKGEKYNLLWKS